MSLKLGTTSLSKSPFASFSGGAKRRPENPIVAVILGRRVSLRSPEDDEVRGIPSPAGSHF
jgi:hypothetical protein